MTRREKTGYSYHRIIFSEGEVVELEDEWGEGYWLLVTGCWLLVAGGWILRCLMQDTRCKIQNAGCRWGVAKG